MKEDILERLDEIIGQHAERMNGLQPAQAYRFWGDSGGQCSQGRAARFDGLKSPLRGCQGARFCGSHNGILVSGRNRVAQN